MTPILRASDGIVLSVLGLLCLGVVMVNSAGLTIDPEQAVTIKSILWSRQALYLVLAMVSMAGGAMLPLGRMRFSPDNCQGVIWLLPLLAGVVLLAYAPVIGHAVNGSSRWIRLPIVGVTLQPSELAKWGVLVVLAWFCALRAPEMHLFKRGLAPGLCIVGPLAALIALEDLGTGVLIVSAACVVLVAAGARLWQLALLAPLGLVAVGVAVLASPYRVRRLTAFLDPYADPDGAGYHMIQSLVAVSNGRVFGRGLGFGLQKFGYLPEDRTDFLFAVVCEELGIAGAVIVLALISCIVWCGISIVLRQESRFLRLLGLGIVATFGLQSLINLMVVTGLGPTKGIALPLMSSGGTGWIVTAGGLGVLVAMDRLTRAREANEPEGGSSIPAFDLEAESSTVAA